MQNISNFLIIHLDKVESLWKYSSENQSVTERKENSNKTLDQPD